MEALQLSSEADSQRRREDLPPLTARQPNIEVPHAKTRSSGAGGADRG